MRHTEKVGGVDDGWMMDTGLVAEDTAEAIEGTLDAYPGQDQPSQWFR